VVLVTFLSVIGIGVQVQGTPHSPAAARPVDLRCEYLTDPAVIDEPSPRLSWRLAGERRGLRQTGYEIRVSSTKALALSGRGDLWETGEVHGAQTSQIPYRGQALSSRQRCYWRVRVRDDRSRWSSWSDLATWSMGLLRREDWQAQFISYRDATPLHTNLTELWLPPARHYRKSFDLAKPVRRATAYATALGLYELHLNGERVGDAWFTPGWTDYRKRAYYQAYDVTRLLRRGDNAVGAVVTEGWYSGYLGFGLLVGYGPHKTGRSFYGKTPALLVQVEIEFADGERWVVATDDSWKVTDQGPIREADLLMGETYDARREMEGWSRAGFDDASWEAAIPAGLNPAVRALSHDGGGAKDVELGFIAPGKLQAYPSVPVRVTQELRPISVKERAPGVFIFDFGQNFAGVVRLRVRGPAGTRVQLRFGEMLHPDGRLMTENLRKARATDAYILRGDPAGETWVPRFTFHGFQFAEITGYPGQPGLEALAGLVLHSDTPLTSEFTCSDPMVNRLFQNVVWTQRANFLELPTDCPQRDERLGWMGDAQVYVRTATWNADVAAFFTKWLREVEEAQLPSGAYPDFAPFPMQHGEAFATGWMDAGVILPWTLHRVYGDTRLVDRHYASMQRFMEFRRRSATNDLGVIHGNPWGDWLSLGETTPSDYLDTVYLALTARRMADMASALGRTEDAAGYRAWVERVQRAFQSKYLSAEGVLAIDTQTAHTLALYADLVPERWRAQVAGRLAAKIRENEVRMATGFLGTQPLLPVLSATGEHDLAVRLLQSRRFPSWGYEIENGATTIWERWNSYTKDQGFGDASMNSFSHYSFGAVCEWMFQTLAGIDTEEPGFHRLKIAPQVPRSNSNPEHAPIHWVRAHYDSPHGRVGVAWKRAGDRFHLDVQIPPNTTANVHLPARDSASIVEGGRALRKVAAAVQVVRHEPGMTVLAVPAGRYRFESLVP
jgi:alpha-L-rhamnosidase